MSATVRFFDEHGHVIAEEELDDPMAYLQGLDQLFPPKPDPERNARFELVMKRRQGKHCATTTQRRRKRRRG